MDNKESYQLHSVCIIQCTVNVSVSGFARGTGNCRQRSTFAALH